MLNKIKPSENEDKAVSKTENIKKANGFIKDTLVTIKNEDDALLFIRNNIKEYFNRFTGEDIKALIRTYKTTSVEESAKTLMKRKRDRLI